MNKFSATAVYKRQFNQLLIQELKLHLPNQLISLHIEETDTETLIFVQFGDSDELALFPIEEDYAVFIELVTNASVSTVQSWFNDCTKSIASAINVAYNEFLTSLTFQTSMDNFLDLVKEMKEHISDKDVRLVCSDLTHY